MTPQEFGQKVAEIVAQGMVDNERYDVCGDIYLRSMKWMEPKGYSTHVLKRKKWLVSEQDWSGVVLTKIGDKNVAQDAEQFWESYLLSLITGDRRA